MKKLFSLSLMLCSLCLFSVGCKGDEGSKPSDEGQANEAGAHDHEHEDGEEDHDHEGDEHSDEEGVAG